MEETDWAYIAGLIDGEGHVTITTQGTITVIVSMTTYQPPRWMWDTVGGNLNYSKIRGQWKWSIGGDQAFILLGRTSPYLKLKVEQANLAIRYWQGKVKFGGKIIPEQEKIWRDQQYLTMRLLNRHGKGFEQTPENVGFLK